MAGRLGGARARARVLRPPRPRRRAASASRRPAPPRPANRRCGACYDRAGRARSGRSGVARCRVPGPVHLSLQGAAACLEPAAEAGAAARIGRRSGSARSARVRASERGEEGAGEAARESPAHARSPGVRGGGGRGRWWRGARWCSSQAGASCSVTLSSRGASRRVLWRAAGGGTTCPPGSCLVGCTALHQRACACGSKPAPPTLPPPPPLQSTCRLQPGCNPAGAAAIRLQPGCSCDQAATRLAQLRSGCNQAGAAATRPMQLHPGCNPAGAAK